jgi:hypothetical protein
MKSSKHEDFYNPSDNEGDEEIDREEFAEIEVV